MAKVTSYRWSRWPSGPGFLTPACPGVRTTSPLLAKETACFLPFARAAPGRPRTGTAVLEREQLVRGRASLQIQVSAHLVLSLPAPLAAPLGFSAESGPACPRRSEATARAPSSPSASRYQMCLSGDRFWNAITHPASHSLSAAPTRACGPSATVAGAPPGRAPTCMPRLRERFSWAAPL